MISDACVDRGRGEGGREGGRDTNRVACAEKKTKQQRETDEAKHKQKDPTKTKSLSYTHESS